MKDYPENKNFEEQWKGSLDSAEVKPPENVWTGIDAHLANQAAGNYKRRALIYRWVAAASVLILLSWTGYFLYNTGTSEDNQPQTTLNEQELTLPENNTSPSLASSSAEQDGDSQDQYDLEEKEIVENSLAENNKIESSALEAEIPTTNVDDPAVSEDITGASLAIQGTDQENQESLNDANHLRRAVNSLFEERDQLVASNNEFEALEGLNGYQIVYVDADPDLNIEGQPVWDFELEKEKVSQAMYAGLNFSPGIFDPNFSNTSTAANSLAEDSFSVPVSSNVSESRVDQGFSYGFGLNAGLPVGRRWVLEGGLAYAVGNTQTSSSLVVESNRGVRSALVFTNSDVAEFQSNSVSISAPSDVTSRYEFISVPVKAGYSILNKEKVGLILSAGFSSDFFLRNTISSDQSGVSSFRQSAGSDSPFRSVYFSGLSSVTFSYRFASNYMVLIEPSYKAALNNFSKSSELFESRPNSFGIGVGIRYQFKK